MIDAARAKELTENIIASWVSSELETIGNKIDEAIADGKFSISTDALEKHTITKIKELGYRVEVGGRMNETSYFISW